MFKLQVRSLLKCLFLDKNSDVDPRREFEAEKQRMINNFVSLARSDKSDRSPSSRGSTPTNQLPSHHSDQLDIEKMKRDNELSKQRLESLRREVKERV